MLGRAREGIPQWAIDRAHNRREVRLIISRDQLPALWDRFITTHKAHHRRAIDRALREPERNQHWWCQGVLRKDGTPIPFNPNAPDMPMCWSSFLDAEHKAREQWQQRRNKFGRNHPPSKEDLRREADRRANEQKAQRARIKAMNERLEQRRQEREKKEEQATGRSGA